MDGNMDEYNKLWTFIRNWFVAGSAAVVARTITAPIDRIKIILQTQETSPQLRQLGIQPYKNFWDCFTRLREQQGVKCYWRGNAANLTRYIPSVAFSFAFNDLFKSYIMVDEWGLHDPDRFWDQLWRHMLCGALAGMATHTLIHPMAKCHTQMCGDVSVRGQYTGMLHCLKDNYHKLRLNGLYAGYISAVIGVSVYRSAYFGIFETCKYQIDDYYGARVPFVASLALAQLPLDGGPCDGHVLTDIGHLYPDFEVPLLQHTCKEHYPKSTLRTQFNLIKCEELSND